MVAGHNNTSTFSMKNFIWALALGTLLWSCGSGEFEASKLRGTYSMKISDLVDDEVDENDPMAAMGKAMMASMSFNLTFEDNGKGSMGLDAGGLAGMMQGLADAMGDEGGSENIEEQLSQGEPIEWKAEGMTLMINNGDEWEELGTIVDFKGYDEITLEATEDGKSVKYVLKKK